MTEAQSATPAIILNVFCVSDGSSSSPFFDPPPESCPPELAAEFAEPRGADETKRWYWLLCTTWGRSTRAGGETALAPAGSEGLRHVLVCRSAHTRRSTCTCIAFHLQVQNSMLRKACIARSLRGPQAWSFTICISCSCSMQRRLFVWALITFKGSCGTKVRGRTFI